MIPTENVIGPYRLLSTLGKGGMGVVLRAEHQDTGQIVALKTILVPKKGMLRSIRREIQSLARLRHPGIVKIVEEGVHQGLPYYAMELVEGQTLSVWREGLSTARHAAPQPPQDTDTTQLSYQLTEQPSSEILELIEEDDTRHTGTAVGMAIPLPEVPLQPILTLMRRLCSALSSLHSEGIVHRDLKPENILVLPGGFPVLVDFGIASAQSMTGREQMTLGDRSQQGTISYMSMEQIQGDPLDARADLFALGVIFFELLTGRRPFSGDNPQAVLWSLFSQTPPKPSQLVANIPEALDELVLRLISKERNDRPGYAADVAQALLALGAEPDPDDDALRAKTYLYRPSFSGRAKELERLRQRAIRVRNEQGGLLLVEGESGVGKTRLLLEAGRDLSQRGFTVFLGECKDAGVALNAFRKVLQDLSDRCVERGPAEAERLFGRRGKLLSRYEPSLRGLDGQGEHPEPTEDAPQEALFQALVETLSAASPEQPLVLLLDDLQWADELSLEFLDFFLARGLWQRWILVVGAYRAEEVGKHLKRIIATPNLEKVALGRLPEAAVAQMVGDMLALHPPPNQLSRYLAEHSFGNPFFVAEYLRAAVDEKLLRRDSAGRWQVVGAEDEAGENISGRWQPPGAEANYDRLELPKTLKALIERRVAGLSKSARTALESFAVIGRVAELELLGWVVPLTEDMLEEALDELSRRQIIEEAGPSKLRIIHEKIRELSYGGLSPKARSGLHRATAEAIEGMYEDRGEHLADLGHHWEQAGATEKARQYYLRGARRAVQVYSHKEAERLYLDFFRLTTSPSRESIIARNELAEKVYQVKGRFAEAEEEHHRALEEARGLALQEEIIDSLRNMGQLKRWRGEPENAGRYLAEAHHLALELQDQRRLGTILNTIANLHLFRGQLESAQHLYQQALEAHRVVENTRMEGITLTNLATLYLQQGQPERSLPLFEQAVQIAIHLKDPRIEASALLNIAALFVQQGELEQAHQIFEKALRIFRELGDRRFEAIALAELADLERWRSRELSEASRLASQAEALLREVGDKQALGKLLRLRGHLAISQGESAQAFIDEVEGLAVELRAEPESDLRQRLRTLIRAEQARQEQEPKVLLRGQRLDDLPEPLKQRVLASEPS